MEPQVDYKFITFVDLIKENRSKALDFELISHTSSRVILEVLSGRYDGYRVSVSPEQWEAMKARWGGHHDKD